MRYLIPIFVLIVLTSCNGLQEHSQEERFKDAVVRLRQAGLFAGSRELDDDQLTKNLIEKAKEKYQLDGYNAFDEVFDPETNSDVFDLYVAALDETRVWWKDLEADILNGNNVYAETVKEFAQLSGGFLKADKIQEEWGSDEGPVKVSFWDSDTLRVFNLKYYDDWYDTDFFKYLESSMKFNGSPYQLYIHDRTGQDVFVIRLTAHEKHKIERIMDWKLVEF